MSNVIFAPHVDDETIGCWSALENRSIHHVLYFFDITPERKLEAYKAAERFGFEPHFTYPRDADSKWRTIYIPASSDAHPGHKLVNQFGRSFALKNDAKMVFYGVDMNFRIKVLPGHHQQSKRHDLETLYPSQKALWQNEKYWLFESLFHSEYSITKTYITASHMLQITAYMDANLRFEEEYFQMLEIQTDGNTRKLMDLIVERLTRFGGHFTKIWLCPQSGEALEYING